MRSRIYASAGVRPSVCLSVPARARPAEDIDRLLHGAQQRGVRLANAGSGTLSATDFLGDVKYSMEEKQQQPQEIIEDCDIKKMVFIYRQPTLSISEHGRAMNK